MSGLSFYNDKILLFIKDYSVNLDTDKFNKNDYFENPTDIQINKYWDFVKLLDVEEFNKLKEINDEKFNKLNNPINNDKFINHSNIKIKELQKKYYEDIKEKVVIILMQKHPDKSRVTEEIVSFIKTNSKIYTIRQDKDVEMWIYDKNKGIYVPEAQTYIKELCRNILDEKYSTQLLNDIIRKIEADTFIESDELFKENLNEICVNNGILNIKDRTLSSFNTEKRFFSQIPVKYDKTQDCEKIKKFISEIVEDVEDIKLLQELLGYCVYKNYHIEKGFIFLGKGRNGKSQLIELIKSFVGIENTSNITLQKICDEESFEISELHKKLVNLGGDVSKETLNNTGLFKSLTGNDQIQAKRKFKSSLKFRNYAKMVFACNDLPKSLDNSDAFFDRIFIIKFPYRFEYQERINELTEEEKINVKPRKNDVAVSLTTENELSGLLNWALDGLDRLLKQEHFTFTNSQKNMKDKYIKLSDSFAAFCSEEIKEEYESMIKKEELRQHYTKYCQINRVAAVSDKYIKTYLTKELGAFEDRYRQENLQIPIWKNIAFGKGGKDGKGFSSLGKLLCFSIGSNTHTNPTNPTISTKSLKLFVANKGKVTKTELFEYFSSESKNKIIEILSDCMVSGDIFENPKDVYNIKQGGING